MNHWLKTGKKFALTYRPAIFPIKWENGKNDARSRRTERFYKDKKIDKYKTKSIYTFSKSFF